MRRFAARSRAITQRTEIPARLRRPAVDRLEERLCLSGYLLVSSFDNNSVLRYDESTGAFVDAFIPKQSGGLREPVGVVYGPDQNLYVASGLEADQGTGHKDVLRYDGTTGAFLDTFVAPDSGGLDFPTLMTFTETDPATLNYDEGAAGAATAIAGPQPTAAAPMTSAPGTPSGGGRSGLAAVPGSPSNIPPPAGATRPTPQAAPVPLLLLPLISDLPPDAEPVDSALSARKSPSAADRILASLDVRLLLNLSANAPALAPRD